MMVPIQDLFKTPPFFSLSGGEEFQEEIQLCRDLWIPLLGSEVDKPSKDFIKTSNVVESNIQNTKAPRIDDPIV